jgi:phosphatidylglycerol:prolipoprotein diacylglycerol transferase
VLTLFPERTVFLDFFGFAVRWYGVLYLVAILLAWRLAPRLANLRQLRLTRDEWLYVITACLAGVLIGGRLGYVLFYEPSYFLHKPLEVLALSEGGMSSHGGFIGVALALLWASRRLKVTLLALADVAVVPAALWLALGRLGNFINQELYLSVAAHLTAILKNLVIAAAAYWYVRTTPGARPGGAVALFLVLYGGLRFLTEYLRQQTEPPVLGLWPGQWLTLPILCAGVLLWIWLRKSGKKPLPQT